MILFFISAADSSYSQSWNRTGNNILNTDYLGVNNPIDFVFKTTPVGGTFVLERMRITTEGNFGFGTVSPAGLWSPSLSFNISSTSPEFRINNNTDSSSLSIFNKGNNNFFHSNRALYVLLDTLPGNDFIIARRNNNLDFNTGDNVQLLKLNQQGMLYVRGLNVLLDTFPDFVFHPSYHPMPLSELKEYVEREQHLPGMPSAKEIATYGLDVGVNQALLLQKIEELTLYIISLKEELDILKKKTGHEKE